MCAGSIPFFQCGSVAVLRRVRCESQSEIDILPKLADCIRMTDAERRDREQRFRRSFEQEFPDFARKCALDVEMVILHQDAFAGDYQEDEFTKLGKAIKYAGLMGKVVNVIGRNAETLRPMPA